MGSLSTVGQAGEEFSSFLHLHQANHSHEVSCEETGILCLLPTTVSQCEADIPGKPLLRLKPSECECDATSGSSPGQSEHSIPPATVFGSKKSYDPSQSNENSS